MLIERFYIFFMHIFDFIVKNVEYMLAVYLLECQPILEKKNIYY